MLTLTPPPLPPIPAADQPPTFTPTPETPIMNIATTNPTGFAYEAAVIIALCVILFIASMVLLWIYSRPAGHMLHTPRTHTTKPKHTYDLPDLDNPASIATLEAACLDLAGSRAYIWNYATLLRQRAARDTDDAEKIESLLFDIEASMNTDIGRDPNPFPERNIISPTTPEDARPSSNVSRIRKRTLDAHSTQLAAAAASAS